MPDARPRPGPETELRELLARFCAALVAHNTAALGELLADDYLFTTPDGQVLTKKQRLDAIRVGSAAPITSLDYDEVRVRPCGGQVAVLTGRYTERRADDSVTHGRVTNTYECDASGRWRMVAGQNALVDDLGPPRPAVVVAPGEGQDVSGVQPGGDRARVVLAGEATGGAFFLMAGTVPPGGGPPPHVHSREDETWFVLDGEWEFHVGDQTVRAAAGTTVFGPRGVPHAFKNVGDQPGRMLLINSPAGQEKFFEEAAAMTNHGRRPPDPAAMTELARRFGVEFLPGADQPPK